MDNLYLIRRDNNQSREKYVSPMRGNGDGVFLWDGKIHAYVFTDETLTDSKLLDFLSGEKYQIIKIDNDLVNAYKRHERY